MGRQTGLGAHDRDKWWPIAKKFKNLRVR